MNQHVKIIQLLNNLFINGNQSLLISCYKVTRCDSVQYQINTTFNLENKKKDWYSFFIYYVTVCDGDMYGYNCSILCGKCFESEQCHHVNGTCMNGCDSGYQGEHCTEGNSVVFFEENTIFFYSYVLQKNKCLSLSCRMSR